MCPDKKCPEETPCVKVSEVESKCADRKLTVSNSNHEKGYENVNVITPEVNQISAYTEHLEFVNSPEQVSGIPKHTVIRFASKFVEYLKNLFRAKNLGTGEIVYKGFNVITKEQEFKTIKSSESVNITSNEQEIKADVNKTWLANQISIPNVDYPVIDGKSNGNGVSIYDGLLNKKILIASLKSNTLVIEKNLDGNIYIENRADFNYLTSYYVNSNYVPTDTSPSDGSIIRPFNTYEQARLAVIGNGTMLNPQFAGKRIIIQTNVVVTSEPLVNSTTIELQNRIQFVYTGTETYVFDMERLYNLCPKNTKGEITQNLSMGLVGNGHILRNNGVGLIKVIGAKRGSSTTTDNHNRIWFTLTEKDTDEIILMENIDYPDSIWQGVQMREDNVTPVGKSYIPEYDMRYTNLIEPTVPLVHIEGSSFTSFSFCCTGQGSLSFYTFANTALKVIDSLTSFKSLFFTVRNERISVLNSVRDIPGRPDIYRPKKFPCCYFKNANLYVKEIYNPNGGTFGHFGWNTFIKIVGTFNFTGNFRFSTNFYINTFFDLEESTDGHLNINQSPLQATIYSNIENLIKVPSIYGTVDLVFPGTFIYNYKKLTFEDKPITFNTLNTMSVLGGNTIMTGIKTFADSAGALAGGLKPNTFFKKPDGTLSII